MEIYPWYYYYLLEDKIVTQIQTTYVKNGVSYRTYLVDWNK